MFQYGKHFLHVIFYLPFPHGTTCKFIPMFHPTGVGGTIVSSRVVEVVYLCYIQW